MKTKFKKLFPVLVLLIATILATSCETQEEFTQSNQTTRCKTNYVKIDDVPFLIPSIVKYNSKYKFLLDENSNTSRAEENLDLDLEHILEFVNSNGLKSYSININKEFTEYDDKYFENLHIYKILENYKAIIIKYNAIDDNKEFDINTFSGDIEYYDSNYNLLGYAQLNDGRISCNKIVVGDFAFVFYNDGSFAVFIGEETDGGGGSGWVFLGGTNQNGSFTYIPTGNNSSGSTNSPFGGNSSSTGNNNNAGSGNGSNTTNTNYPTAGEYHDPIIIIPNPPSNLTTLYHNYLTDVNQQNWLQQHLAIKLKIIDYLQDHHTVEDFQFASWTVDYLYTNQTVTWEVFQNQFIGTAEGQEGIYNSNFWENPNLNFPPQDLPTWVNFQNAFPLDTNPLYNTPEKMYNSIGGSVANLYSGPQTNTCAIRLSKALNYSGIIIPNIPGKTYKGADNKYYFKAAYEINLWMRITFGTNPASNTNPVTPFNANHHQYTQSQAGVHGANLPSLLNGMHGIYSIYSSNFNWATGHADLLNSNATCGNHCLFYEAPIYRLDIWELP